MKILFLIIPLMSGILFLTSPYASAQNNTTVETDSSGGLSSQSVDQASTNQTTQVLNTTNSTNNTGGLSSQSVDQASTNQTTQVLNTTNSTNNTGGLSSQSVTESQY